MSDDEDLAKLGIRLSSEEVVARAKGKKESDGPSAEENEDEDKQKQRNKHLWRKYMKIITMVRMRRFVNYTLGLIIRC